ncbi:MAG: hypothetical protein WD824_04295 [Cyclobacteriaceae bacterium]
MKNYLLVAALLILILNNLFAEIKNGYEKDIAGAKVSLQGLRYLLDNCPELTSADRGKIKEKVNAIVNFLVYHEITDTLLNQFRRIAPELYNEMDTLKDNQGRVIDVYVKFIPKEQAQLQAAGMATFKQAENDLNSCDSEYGKNSVSVKVWILHKALRVLSHEFGHVQYSIPNLRSYAEFYEKKYKMGLADPILGHRHDDPSGKHALLFEERFRDYYMRYLKGDSESIVSPLVLINPIKRNVLQHMNN